MKWGLSLSLSSNRVSGFHWFSIFVWLLSHEDFFFLTPKSAREATSKKSREKEKKIRTKKKIRKERERERELEVPTAATATTAAAAAATAILSTVPRGTDASIQSEERSAPPPPPSITSQKRRPAVSVTFALRWLLKPTARTTQAK